MITLVKAGLLATVQDVGRPGYRASGMPVSGPMDRLAHAAANLLAGNDPGAAAVELTFTGGTWRFEAPLLAALAGADMGAVLDGAPLASWGAFRAPAGSTLTLGHARAGVRAYLAVRGGIAVPPVLGSRSTYTRARVGGLQGRALVSGDRLPVGKGRGRAPTPRALATAGLPPCGGGEVRLRVILGPQADLFEEDGIAAFLETTWKVTPQNDRMGYRLTGPPIPLRGPTDILTDALVPGAVQVTGDGLPIAMMVDCQTTGGYAKIAVVIGPDLRLLAQARAGDPVRFVRCTQAEAVKVLKAERAALVRIVSDGSRPVVRASRAGR